LTFNIAYDTGIFPLERHRLHLMACYQIMCHTGARPAELVDGERKEPKHGSVQEIFGRKALPMADPLEDGEVVPSDHKSKLINRLLLQETASRGLPKALCYEDILMMIVRHPVTGLPILAMAIKFIHHKGADNKPKPYALL